MGGAASVPGDGTAAGSSEPLLGFEEVKGRLGAAWCDEVGEKLSLFNENKSDNEMDKLSGTEIKDLMEWLEQKGIVSKDKLDELRSDFWGTSEDDKESMANMKETVTRPLSPLVQTSDTGQTSGIVTSETSNDNGPSIKTNNNKSNKKEAICLQPKTSEKITATSTVKSRGKGTGKAKNVIERETLPSTALRCVSLAFLLRFTDHYKLWHHLTKDVVGEVIVPLSKQQQCVWSDIDPSISLLQPDDIAPPQIFVSHAWTNSWGLLVLGVKAYAEFNKVSAKKLTCWIDIFVINQHNYMQELKQLDRVIEVCGNFIQIIDSECAVPLTRVWCLYEVMSRLKHKKSGGLTVTVASITPPSESQSIDTCSDVDGNIDNKVEITSHNAADSSAVTTTITSTPVRPTLLLASQNRIDTVLKQVNMEKAQATYPEDVEKILNLVRTEIPGGFSTVNAQVREALVRNSVLNMFQNAAGAAGSKVVRKGEKKGRHKAGGKSSGGHNIANLYSGLE